MTRSRTGLLFGLLVLLALLMALAPLKRATHPTASAPPPDSPPSETCPVCGMRVAPYPNWRAQLQFKDGSIVHFDGMKDLFQYYFAVERYHPKRMAADIRGIRVTDYYSLEPLDGYQARYVLGGDVLGPMGRELIPFATEPAAREFLRDHHGDRILTFEEITLQLISRLQ